MSLQYSHLLIPDRPDFVPQPAQVIGFLKSLEEMGSAPLDATFRVAKPSGRVRTGSDPMTGKRISIPVRDFTSLRSVSEIKEQVATLDDYDIILSGTGPPKLPPFRLYTVTQTGESEFKDEYSYEVNCSLRAEVVSTCDLPPFKSPCRLEGRSGTFHHPNTGTVIEVPNTACGRFWIAFQFGKWLTPHIDHSLNLMHPSIVSNANDQFGAVFAQGCIVE